MKFNPLKDPVSFDPYSVWMRVLQGNLVEREDIQVGVGTGGELRFLTKTGLHILVLEDSVGEQIHQNAESLIAASEGATTMLVDDPIKGRTGFLHVETGQVHTLALTALRNAPLYPTVSLLATPSDRRTLFSKWLPHWKKELYPEQVVPWGDPYFLAETRFGAKPLRVRQRSGFDSQC